VKRFIEALAARPCRLRDPGHALGAGHGVERGADESGVAGFLAASLPIFDIENCPSATRFPPGYRPAADRSASVHDLAIACAILREVISHGRNQDCPAIPG